MLVLCQFSVSSWKKFSFGPVVVYNYEFTEIKKIPAELWISWANSSALKYSEFHTTMCDYPTGKRTLMPALHFCVLRPF